MANSDLVRIAEACRGALSEEIRSLERLIDTARALIEDADKPAPASGNGAQIIPFRRRTEFGRGV